MMRPNKYIGTLKIDRLPLFFLAFSMLALHHPGFCTMAGKAGTGLEHTAANRAVHIILLADTLPIEQQPADALLKFKAVTWAQAPLINKGSAGTAGNKNGLEGGTVIKLKGLYHLFTAEMFDTINVRLAHWTSQDAKTWNRKSTLFSGDGNYDGSSIRSSLWSPMPVWDAEKNVWNFFYVGYRGKPNTASVWYMNFDGRVWQAQSQVKGLDGIGGPYKDRGVVLSANQSSGKWEGLQGTDSFFPYRVGKAWYGFFGSAQTQYMPCRFWGIGLAKAAKPEGPWVKLNDRNPTNLGSQFAENPVVTRLSSGLYVAMIDGGHINKTFGYTVSRDGVHWSKATFIQLPAAMPHWWELMRTPLSLIAEPNGTYTTFFTAKSKLWAGLGEVSFQLFTRAGDKWVVIP